MQIKDGNKAVSDVAYMFSQLCAIYPITPSSPMASNIDNLSNKKVLNAFNYPLKVIQMQSEAGVAGVLHGALATGLLATTFTSSQGLLLMIPQMYKIAGEMLPAVIHVASRSLSTHSLSIYGDHQDIYATRQTGFCIISSSSVENSQYMAAIAHLAAIKSRLPFLHFIDGFRTSHEINTIDNFAQDQILNLIDNDSLKDFRHRAINLNHNSQRGMAMQEDIYFQTTEARNVYYNQVFDIVNDYMNKINEIANIDIHPMNYHGSLTAKYIIIAMGSVCSTIKLVVDDLNSLGKEVGMVEVNLYRPFNGEYLKKILPATKACIAVLDRTKEAGSLYEPLCLDVIASLKDENIKIVGGRYGLSSKNVSPAQIKSVFDMLEYNIKDHFTIGIEDDLTNLSLPKTDYVLDLNVNEMIIYGYGSDGMVSASKELLQIINEQQAKYVQGYFEYDSKKSRGVTKTYIRVGKTKIDAPFYIEQPKCVVITKDDYLGMFDTISNIKDNGLVLLNTSHLEDLDNFLENDFKKTIKEKNIKLFCVDANKIALECNLNDKISKIMEIILLQLFGVSDSINILSEKIKSKYKTKGEKTVNDNILAITKTLSEVVEIKSDFTVKKVDKMQLNSVYEILERRNGNCLKVSDLALYADGIFPANFSQKNIDCKVKQIPHWKMENCIECSLCSFVCPHGVIRPFIVDKGGLPLAKDEQKRFLIAVNGDKCSGCGLCIDICPGKNKKKALFWEDNTTDDYVRELFNNNTSISDDVYNIKNSQLVKPSFSYCKACAGCGEAAYIKLLTQLLKEQLIIANATGCSSIYGGSLPNVVYELPWASSLFEDNAEFGFGIYLAYQQIRNKIKRVMIDTKEYVSDETQKLYDEYINNMNDYKITSMVQKKLLEHSIPKPLEELVDYIPYANIWCIGGDGWAYDIGFGGIDHVISCNENINFLVLDTESYSNTGGQSSKATNIGAVAEFANLGKKNNKKDLFKMAMTYDNIYVASVCMLANPNQCIKAFKEAIEHEGPSIIIAYSTCVEQGIKQNLPLHCKALVQSGYILLMRYKDNKLYIDSKEPDFDKYEEVLKSETRYDALKIKNPKEYERLMRLNLKNAIQRYDYYKNLSK